MILLCGPCYRGDRLRRRRPVRWFSPVQPMYDTAQGVDVLIPLIAWLSSLLVEHFNAVPRGQPRRSSVTRDNSSGRGRGRVIGR